MIFLVAWCLPGIPLAVLTAVYTGYLFAQAKARDMWQNPLLPPHLLIQAIVLGSAILLPISCLWPENFGSIRPLMILLSISTLIHLLMIWGEVSLAHPTAHARVAVWEMTHGRYRKYFWPGLFLSAMGGLLPLLSFLWSSPHVVPGWITVLGSLPALIGLMLYEHAYVQAGQSVPLA